MLEVSWTPQSRWVPFPVRPADQVPFLSAFSGPSRHLSFPLWSPSGGRRDALPLGLYTLPQAFFWKGRSLRGEQGFGASSPSPASEAPAAQKMAIFRMKPPESHLARNRPLTLGLVLAANRHPLAEGPRGPKKCLFPTFGYPSSLPAFLYLPLPNFHHLSPPVSLGRRETTAVLFRMTQGLLVGGNAGGRHAKCARPP